MQVENRFTIPVGLDEAWKAFNDPERVAPCMPGASLESVDGDFFTGSVKVKLGPISLTYQGKGEFVERDEAAHRVVINASGRDARGNGTASAKITGTLEPAGAVTNVVMVTDMTISGRPAQFGRGVTSDVSDKIVAQFASCLAEQLGRQEAPAEPTAPEPAAGSAEQPPRPAAAPSVPAPTPELAPELAPEPATAAPAAPLVPAARRDPVPSEVDPIDLLDTAGVPVRKRLIPVLAVLVAVLIAVLLWRRRR